MGLHDPFLEGLRWCSGSPGCWSSDLQPRWSLLFHTSRVYPSTKKKTNECWSNPSISQWFIPNSQAKPKLCWWCWWHPPWICHPLWAHSLVIIPKKCHNGSEWCYEAKNDPPSIIFRWKTRQGFSCASELLEQCEALPQVVSYVGTTRVDSLCWQRPFGCGSKWKTDVGPQMWMSSLELTIHNFGVPNFDPYPFGQLGSVDVSNLIYWLVNML